MAAEETVADLEARTWLTPRQVSELLQVDYKAVLVWMRRADDPLPVWYPPGNRKHGRIKREEMDEWLERNWSRAA